MGITKEYHPLLFLALQIIPWAAFSTTTTTTTIQVNTIMTISFINHSSSFLVEPRGVSLVVEDLGLKGLRFKTLPTLLGSVHPYICSFASSLIVL